VERKILVIGDDPATQDLLRCTFSRDRFQVFTTPSRMSVVFQLYLLQPDLLILDTLQPGMDRGKMLKQIRERFSVPIVVLGAQAEHGIKFESLDQGADDFLAKPFSIQELQARVRALLRRAQYAA
jgi:DNA-binding response OmpR family regulator